MVTGVMVTGVMVTGVMVTGVMVTGVAAARRGPTPPFAPCWSGDPIAERASRWTNERDDRPAE